MSKLRIHWASLALWLLILNTTVACIDSSDFDLTLDYGRFREELCGDRILTRSEQCDDGNQIDGDGCSSVCLVEAIDQADEIVGEDAGEPAGESAGELAGETAGELAGETAGESAGETAGESAGETAGESAGEIAGESAGEIAGESAGELAGDNAGEEVNGLLCGDGVVGAGEECDDGNQLAGDGCSAACQTEAQCQDDSHEPNQTTDTASPLTVDASSEALEAMLCEGDLDLYRVEGCAGGHLSISLDFNVFRVDLDLRLTNHEGRLLNSSALDLNAEQIDQILLDDHPVYIEVYGYLNAEEGAYTLSTSLEGCGAVSPRTENCSVLGDEDGNGLADCDDPACANASECNALGSAACQPQNTMLLGGYGVYQGSTMGAPAEERGSCAGSGNERVYVFQAPQSGEVCFDTAGSSYDTALHVRRECSDFNTEIACNDDDNGSVQSALSFNAIAGESYYIFVDGFSSSGSYTLSVSPGSCDFDPPQAEDCALFGDEDGNGLADCDDPVCLSAPQCAPMGPIACEPQNAMLLGGYGVYQGSTNGAPAEERGSCTGGGNERVYIFQSPQSGEVCLDTAGSEYDTALHVRLVCEDLSSEIACNDDANGSLQSSLSFNATAGERYYIFMDGFGGSGNFTLTVSPGQCGAEPPRFEDCNAFGDEDGNGLADCDDPACAQEPLCIQEDCVAFGDEDGNGLADCDDPACVNEPWCAPMGPVACQPQNAMLLGGYGVYQGSTLGAPAEERGSCAGSGNEQVYVFQAVQSGEVCLDTAGSSYDTALHVRRECAAADTEVACNDDANGTFQSSLSFNTIAGERYYIFMDGFGGSGSYTLSVSEGPCGVAPPSAEDCSLFGDEDGNGFADCDDPACFNDPWCASFGPTACQPQNALVLSGYGVYQGSTLGAPAEERGSCAGNGNEQVYLFQAVQSGTVCLDAGGSSYDTALYVRSVCGDSSTEIACNDDANGTLLSTLSFNALAGELYYIFMDGYSGSGSYMLSVSPGACGF